MLLLLWAIPRPILATTLPPAVPIISRRNQIVLYCRESSEKEPPICRSNQEMQQTTMNAAICGPSTAPLLSPRMTTKKIMPHTNRHQKRQKRKQSSWKVNYRMMNLSRFPLFLVRAKLSMATKLSTCSSPHREVTSISERNTVRIIKFSVKGSLHLSIKKEYLARIFLKLQTAHK